MTHDKAKQVMAECAAMISKHLERMNGELAHRGACIYERHTLTPVELKKVDKLEHCIGMVPRSKDWPEEDKDKTMRWLGYMQGVMDALDVADLETLKRMNKA